MRLAEALNRVKALWFALPLRLGLLNLSLTVAALVYLWIFAAASDPDLPFKRAQWVSPVIGTILAVNLETQLFMALGGRRWRRRSVLGTLLVLVTTLLLAYHVKAGASLDSKVVIEHQGDVGLSWDVLSVIGSAFDVRVLVGGVACAFALRFINRRWGLCFPEQPGASRRRVFCNVLLVAGALGCIYHKPTLAYDEVSRLAVQFVPWRSERRLSITIPSGQFPLVHATPPATAFAGAGSGSASAGAGSAFAGAGSGSAGSASASAGAGSASPSASASAPASVPAARPNPSIFLILVESFNANFVETKAPNGLTYTPYFNSLIPTGMYVDRFYGNSVQTVKGHFASLCSLVPTEEMEFKHFGRTRLQCLPQILRQAGYQTIFFQAHRKIQFENTWGFLRRNGFELVETVADHQRQEDEESVWGWGLQDDVYYRRFFEYLDEIRREADADKPLFATLAPISNHMRFMDVPKSERKIYRDPTEPLEYFANSVHVADRGLRVFFQELRRRKQFEDAIVVITGDHSFPVGEHGYDHNEVEAYEEFFRVPFLMVAPGRIEPERIHDVPYSQLDIAPTLLELSGVLPEKTHFQGVSLLGRPAQKHPIPLIQPYAGRYLAVVDFPYKYVFHVRDERARLYDLAEDPGEHHNLADQPGYEAVTARLHRLLRMHQLSEAALLQNQVWPRKQR